VGGDNRSIWVKPLGATQTRRLPETELATGLFWSPDSTAIGFFSRDALKVARLSGGTPEKVSDVPLRAARSGTWNRNGVILYGAAGNPIHRVDASGGKSETITVLSPPEQTTHTRPYFLPNANHFLFLGGNRQTGLNAIYLGALDSSETTRLVTSDFMAAYADPGYLLFTRDGLLLAQRFDVRRLELEGEPIRVAEQLDLSRVDGSAGFTVSNSGGLIFRREDSSAGSQLHWFDRTGKRLGSVGEAGHYRNPNLSANGARIALDRPDGSDIWIVDAQRGVASRFTFEPGLELAPHWSHAGDQILYQSNEKGTFNIYVKPANEQGASRRVLESSYAVGPMDWTRDGKYVVFARHQGFTPDLWVLPMDGEEGPFPLVKTPFVEYQAQVSPDGRWVAYTSNESGRFEVYAQRFPVVGNKVRLSTAGGVQPRWSDAGTELFYVARDLKLMAVTVKPSAERLEPGAAAALFQTRIWGGASTEAGHRAQYAVAPDGNFLINTNAADDAPFTVVLNWHVGLE
jgi:hypothetical protein